jgi:hypothetical protein
MSGDELFETLNATMTGWTAEETIGTELRVPVAFFHGDHDFQTPVTLARRYYRTLCAPWKAWVSFPQSAHVVVIEEPGRFIVELTRLALPAARGERPVGVERGAAGGRGNMSCSRHRAWPRPGGLRAIRCSRKPNPKWRIGLFPRGGNLDLALVRSRGSLAPPGGRQVGLLTQPLQDGCEGR